LTASTSVPSSAGASAVTEPKRSAVEQLGGSIQIGLARGRSVEQQGTVVAPDLCVTRHRLAVQAEIVRVGREQRDRDRVRERAVADQGLVAFCTLPSVGTRDVVGDAMGTRGPCLAGIVLVEPA